MPMPSSASRLSPIPLCLVVVRPFQVEKAAMDKLGPKLEVSRATKRLWQELQQEKVRTLGGLLTRNSKSTPHRTSIFVDIDE